MERLLARKLVRQLVTTTNYATPQPNPLARCQNQHDLTRYFSQRASSSSSNQPKGFIAKVIENMKTEFSQNKDIKESLEKFREETKKLEETEALKQARQKFKDVEAANEYLKTAKDSFAKVKDAKIFSDISSKAETIAKQGEFIKDTSAFKYVSKELEKSSKLYESPPLLKRAERSSMSGNQFERRQVEPNEEAQSIELHKDSKWSQNWKKFRDENPYVNTVFDLKMKYDESDNPIVRLTRSAIDKVSDTLGFIFQTTDTSQVLTEICKVDPNFELNEFLLECEKYIIPTILEAISQNRLDILEDWCYEAVFNVLSQPQKAAQKLGYTIKSETLTLDNVELALGKMMEHGPVLVITFQAHQVTYAQDAKGNVVEGDPDKVIQNTYVMAFCRDQEDIDPKTAWRLIDVAMQQTAVVL